jgi:hypothetical protein
MAEARAQLVLHCGARKVSRDELAAVKTPPPQGRWFPVPHLRVRDTARRTIEDAGYEVRREEFGLSRNDARFFGVMDLGSTLAEGVTLAVGIRSSTDKSFPLGFVAGNRVFACDNLAFRSELLVKRKHTVNGERRFNAAIAEAVAQLAGFKEAEAGRIRKLGHAELKDSESDSIILTAFERGIVSARVLPHVIREWREPTFEEFQPRTAWSLLNCFTTVLGKKDGEGHLNQAKLAVTSMRLNAHLDRELLAFGKV